MKPSTHRLLIGILVSLLAMAVGSRPANAQSFALTGSLNTAHVGHTATRLNNGIVLIAGGVGTSGSSLAEAELYNPATGVFTPTGSLNTGRAFHTATLLNNGMVLIAGGCSGCPLGTSGPPLADAELYNPTTGTFSTTGSLNTARSYHAATLLNNGMVLIGGGLASASNFSALVSAELYDPAAGTFTFTGSLNNARFIYTATLLNNGMVLMAGGAADPSTYLASAELYNPGTGVFTPTGSLNVGRNGNTATLLNNGMVLIAGGGNTSGILADAELYDRAAGTFTLTANNMISARSGHTATLLANGMVLVAGGHNSGGYLAAAELYNPAAGTFTPTGSLNTARWLHTATLLNNGMVLVAAGNNSSGYLASAELYAAPDNTPPLVSNVLANPDPVAANSGLTLTATIDDSTTGGSNIASAQYNVNGASFIPMQAADGSFNEVTENVIASVAPFSAAGVYNLCVTGTDSAGNTSDPSCIPLPVYDPSGGFVTGGGSILSPAGKDLVNTAAAGPATFGFVSKYLKGTSTPSGNLEFHFDAGNLHFKSNSMDWLVVTGEPRAQFHGTGTINGASVCQFAVNAWSKSFRSTNGSVDAFGIKVYSCNSGGDINGNRYSIDATPLSGGSIIIHR